MNAFEMWQAVARLEDDKGPAMPQCAADLAKAQRVEACAAELAKAANFIEKAQWVEAYIELNSAATICWELREKERRRVNTPLKEGSSTPS